MRKIPHKDRKVLKEIAKNLPDTYYKYNQKFIGNAISNDHNRIMNNTHGQGLEIVRHEKVMYQRKAMKKINHLKRLKKAFLKGGWQGVVDYFDWVNANNKRINQEYKMTVEMKTIEEILKAKIKPLFGSEHKLFT